jgi:hypothetical protein
MKKTFMFDKKRIKKEKFKKKDKMYKIIKKLKN